METDDQISKEEVSEPTEISPDNPTSVTSTPIDKNKRTRSTAFSPDDKEKNQYPRLDQDDSNLEPDEEPETDVPVIKLASTMSDLKDKPNGIKPFRAYQEHAQSRELAKTEKCAVYEFTIDKLNSKLSEFTLRTPTYQEILLVLLLEHEMQDTVTSVICDHIDSLLKLTYEVTLI